MLRFRASLVKEILLLLRDRGGLAILFLMPAILVMIMALIQDAPFSEYLEVKIPLALVDEDKGDFGETIRQMMDSSRAFDMTYKEWSEEELKSSLNRGEYVIGIVIPKGISQHIAEQSHLQAKKILASLGFDEENAVQETTPTESEKQIIKILFKPGTKPSFRNTIQSALRQETGRLETQHLMMSFRALLGSEGHNEEALSFGNLISFEEAVTQNGATGGRELNSVQHNVPAWTLFGIFFIVLALAGSMVKEREDGSYHRLRTTPGSYFPIMLGKVVAYLSVSMIQCVLMLGVGIYIMPLLGLPALGLGAANGINVILVSVSSGLAAIGIGIFAGTLFNTNHQTSSFGSVVIVILAALGGIWVPIEVMPEIIQKIAVWTPMQWGLEAFQRIFLGSGRFDDLASELIKLFLFFVVTIAISFLIGKHKRLF